MRRIDIVGDRATLRLDFIAQRLEEIGAEGVVAGQQDGFDVAEAYRAELAELLDAQAHGGTTFLPLADGLRSTRLAIAARAMAGLGA